MEIVLLEESCDSFDLLELGKQQDVCFYFKYFIEELRRIFIEDIDLEIEDFVGFMQSDLNGKINLEVMVVELDLSDDGKVFLVSEEKEDEKEDKVILRRSRFRRSSIGF